MRSLFISLQSEFYKSRKTLAFWASILLPVVICGLIAFGFFTQSEKIIKVNYPPQILWFQLIRNTISLMGMLILPFYVIFMAFSVNNIEHKNDTWKTLFIQPLNKFSIYSSKYLFGVILIFICLALFAILTLFSGYLLHVLNNGFKFNEFSPVAMLSQVYLKLFLAALGIFSIQFILSLIWADFLKPMGIGFVLTIIGIITSVASWKYAYLIPYSSPSAVTSFKGVKNPMEGGFTIFTEEIWVSLSYAVALFIIGYFIVAKKSIK